MAHEELKALYEIDKQHSDTPWEFWQFGCRGAWFDLPGCSPLWNKEVRYRRKPDAPVWGAPEITLIAGESIPDDNRHFSQMENSQFGARIAGALCAEADKEDARKWKEAVFQSLITIDDREFRRNFLNILNPKQPQLIQGYTAEQWQRIIDEGFLCEFSADADFCSPSIGKLSEVLEIREIKFSPFDAPARRYCRPLRIKGVRQPWFGGECPATGDVVIKMRDGQVRLTSALMSTWQHSRRSNDIVEFIEL